MFPSVTFSYSWTLIVKLLLSSFITMTKDCTSNSTSHTAQYPNHWFYFQVDNFRSVTMFWRKPKEIDWRKNSRLSQAFYVCFVLCTHYPSGLISTWYRMQLTWFTTGSVGLTRSIVVAWFNKIKLLNDPSLFYSQILLLVGGSNSIGLSLPKALRQALCGNLLMKQTSTKGHTKVADYWT